MPTKKDRRAYFRQYYIDNRAYKDLSTRNWQKANPERHAQMCRNYRKKWGHRDWIRRKARKMIEIDFLDAVVNLGGIDCLLKKEQDEYRRRKGSGIAAGHHDKDKGCGGFLHHPSSSDG